MGSPKESRWSSVRDVRIHPTAEVSPDGGHRSRHQHLEPGPGARATLASAPSCVIGKNVYVDADVVIGDGVKVQNNVSLFHGVTVEDGVFVGPHVCFTNDRVPRAINRDGSLKTDADWEVSPILVRSGAALGANSTILPGVTIGRWAMVGAGSVVTARRRRSRARRRQPGAAARERLRLRPAAARRRREAVRWRLPRCGKPFPPDEG